MHRSTGAGCSQAASIRAVRWWLLTREEARDLARQHVERQGLPWTEPVSVSRALLGGWNVVTQSGNRGGNIFIEITRHGKLKGGTAVTSR
jgi:hypothetical protein